MTSHLSNTLADKAEEIRFLAKEATAADRTAIDMMIQAGRLLAEAKDHCPHGQWAAFLHRAGIHERKASRYMKLARSGLKSDTVSELGGLKAALEHVTAREAFYKLELPSIHECNVLVAYMEDDSDPDEKLTAYIWEDHKHVGYYRLAMLDYRDWEKANAAVTVKPMKPDPFPASDGTILYPFWDFLDHLLDRRASAYTFQLVPDYVGLRSRILEICDVAA